MPKRRSLLSAPDSHPNGRHQNPGLPSYRHAQLPDIRLVAILAPSASFAKSAAAWPRSATSSSILPALGGRLLDHGDVVDLGDRAEVIHTSGHSPGGIALYENRMSILLSGDIIYDGPLIDDIPDYLATLLRIRDLVDEYLAQKRQAGCHLRQNP